MTSLHDSCVIIKDLESHYALVAALPTVVVVVGLLVVWSARGNTTSAVLPFLGLLDLIWCAVALFAK